MGVVYIWQRVGCTCIIKMYVHVSFSSSMSGNILLNKFVLLE